MAALHFVQRQLRNHHAGALSGQPPSALLSERSPESNSPTPRLGADKAAATAVNLVCEASLGIGYWLPGE